VDGKVFFETHADLNRHSYFTRVMISKIVKYLTMKKLSFFKEALRRWKSVIYDFSERDLTNSHIHRELLQLDAVQEGRSHGRSVEEIKSSLVQEKEEQLLSYLLSDNNQAHRQDPRFLFPTAPGTSEVAQQQPLPSRQSEGGSELYSLLTDDYSYENIANFPLQINRDERCGLPYLNPNLALVKDYADYSRRHHRDKRNNVDEQRLLAENTEAPKIFHNQSHLDAQQAQAAAQQDQPTQGDLPAQPPAPSLLPGYNPSEGLPLPILPLFARPKSFKDRLYYDIVQQPVSEHQPVAVSARDYHNPLLVSQSHGEYLLYKTQIQGPTTQSYWLIPGMLMVGNAPFGPAIKKTFDQLPLDLADRLGREGSPAAPGQTSSSTATAGGGKRWSVKNTDLTAIAALLLGGIDTFVSCLSAEDEAVLEAFYQSPPVEVMVRESLEQTKMLSNKIIAENLVLIQKQQQLLLNIPNFGKSDPRYAQAYQEKLRCQGRITLYQNTVDTIKSQIKLLPKTIHFHRLCHFPTAPGHGLNGPGPAGPDLLSLIPWNSAKILPSVWFLEELLRRSHSVYLYSGSFSRPKDDGPTKDGLSGTLGALVLGRLYHLKGMDAIFQWQRTHDFMKILQMYSGDGTDTNPFIPEEPAPAPTSKGAAKAAPTPSAAAAATPVAPTLSTGSKSFSATPSPTKQQAGGKMMTAANNPSLRAVKEHAAHLIYRTSCPPLPWQKALIIEVLDQAHQWINYPIVRSQLTPEIFTILERNHFDISLRNSNAYHDQLADYYTAQHHLPASQNNLPHYFNENTKNPYSFQRQQQQKAAAQQAAKKKNPPGVTVRGDPIAEDEEDDRPPSASSSSASRRNLLPSQSSSSLLAPPASAVAVRKGSLFDSLVEQGASKKKSSPQNSAGPRGRMTVLQRMKQQVKNEEEEEELRRQREQEEKDNFDSSEFQEAQRQEKLILEKSVYRLKQSHYQEKPTG
jgi:hypothetical protein